MVNLSVEQRWVCPNCTESALTYDSPPRFHNCRGLKGLTAPMVLEGTRCKVEAVLREDYVGNEVVTTDGDGAPVMAVETTREDGNDVAAFAACATTEAKVS